MSDQTRVLDELERRARLLMVPGRRRILGVVGAPGVGKSTVTKRLVERLGARASLIAMDGYHLADDVLDDLGRKDRKGAPDTFDVGGFRDMLIRLRTAQDVFVPIFDRAQERALGAAQRISGESSLVVIEGNYLLLQSDGWAGTGALLDECWYLDLDPEERRRRLILRHERHGKSWAEARDWVGRSDEANARLIEDTRRRADAVFQLDERSTDLDSRD